MLDPNVLAKFRRCCEAVPFSVGRAEMQAPAKLLVGDSNERIAEAIEQGEAHSDNAAAIGGKSPSQCTKPHWSADGICRNGAQHRCRSRRRNKTEASDRSSARDDGIGIALCAKYDANEHNCGNLNGESKLSGHGCSVHIHRATFEQIYFPSVQHRPVRNSFFVECRYFALENWHVFSIELQDEQIMED